MAVIALGGGRIRIRTSQIDHRVGFDALKPLGTRVAKGDLIRLRARGRPGRRRKRPGDAFWHIYTIGERRAGRRGPVILAKIT